MVLLHMVIMGLSGYNREGNITPHYQFSIILFDHKTLMILQKDGRPVSLPLFYLMLVLRVNLTKGLCIEFMWTTSVPFLQKQHFLTSTFFVD